MSVTELPPQSPVEESPDRIPPQDIVAEQSVLGAMLLSKDAIAEVVERLRAEDFYRPSHQAVYHAIVDLFGRGEPADLITVSDRLSSSGDLLRVGGRAYLHTLVAGVPTASSAAYYAEIVREKSVLRRLVTAGTRIVGWGYAGEGEVDQIVDRAQAEIYDATGSRTAEDYQPLGDIMEGAIEEIESNAARGGQMVGVPTGFIDLDRLTNGLHAGQLVIVAARPAIGKALAVDTPIPTPDGWTTMGELRVGDRVFGEQGQPTTVLAATEVMLSRPCFIVEFSDGSSIVADAHHKWRVRQDGRSVVGTTAELAEQLVEAGSTGLTLPDVSALRLPERDLLVDPYCLGVWLAHGGQDLPAEIQMRLEGRAGSLAEVGRAARSMGITQQGFIPPAYLRAGEEQRRELLAGLLDVAGEVVGGGEVVFTSESRPLAQGVYELLTTMGIGAVVTGHPPRRTGGVAQVWLRFTTDEAVFTVADKQLRHKDGSSVERRPAGRTIVAITRIPSVPVRCIEVDNPTHLFLAGRSMVPTHNSTLGLDIARSAAVKQGLTTVIFSLEMSRNEIVMRLLSAEAQIPLHHMRSGRMNDPEWSKIAARQGALHEAPLFVDDSPNMTMTEIRAKCRRLRQRHDLRLVIVDYMQLMTSGRKVESRQQEVSEFSRSLKLLAKELEVPVIAISQLNRGPEARNDKRPMLSDLRESGSLEQDADMVILIHREDAYDRDSPRVGEADLIVAKHRNGPTDTVTVTFQGHYSRFMDMAPE